MTCDYPCESTVSVRTDDGVSADIRISGAHVHVDFHLPSPPVPAAVQTRLVDAVLDHPTVRDSASHGNPLWATVPVGDFDLLAELRRRTAVVHTRAAGSTCLVEAEIA